GRASRPDYGRSVASKRPRPSGGSPANRSGNPARAAEAARLAREQQTAAAPGGRSEYEENVRRRRRGLIAWWSVGAVATVAVATVVIWSFVAQPWNEYAIGSVDASSIEGVETFS